jgi:hypothetical protein
MKKLSGGAFSAKTPASERTLTDGSAVSVVLVMTAKMSYGVDKHNCNQ